MNPDVAIRHAFMCIKKGRIKAVSEVRKEWKQTRCGKIMETKSAAPWLIAEGDKQVRKAHDKSKKKMSEALRKRKKKNKSLRSGKKKKRERGRNRRNKKNRFFAFAIFTYLEIKCKS